MNFKNEERESMASAGGGKSKFQNGKLGQTLTDLEAALNDWDSLTDAPSPAAAPTTTPAAAPEKNAELRKKTKMLLDQLREQLAELAD